MYLTLEHREGYGNRGENQHALLIDITICFARNELLLRAPPKPFPGAHDERGESVQQLQQRTTLEL